MTKQTTFVDVVTLYVRAGNGGNGCASFRREKFVPLGGPDGGDGGKGGNVILRADQEIDSLLHLFYAPHQRAQNAGYGKGKKMHGLDGQDLVVPVPCGTEVRDEQAGIVLADIVRHGQEYVAAHGGKGGLGNCHWKSSTHQAPREYTKGEPGQELTLRLVLKKVSDVGLIGFPNAGKSSLLSKISDARPKIAAYPFTTLNPIIGTVTFDDYTRVTVADVPGLIEDAHKGVGLGDAFLRHVERASYLIYVIDMAGSEGREPWNDYHALKKEIKLYKENLPARPSLVAANKMDMPEAAGKLKVFTKKTRTRPIPVSALTGEGIDPLKKAIQEMAVAHDGKDANRTC